MTNRYGGACARCKANVPAETGEARKESNNWRVYCRSCARTQEVPRTEASSAGPIVLVSADVRGDVTIRPAAYLGPMWDPYKGATEGARFDRDAKVSRCSGDRALRIIERLRAAGFTISGDDAVRAVLDGLYAKGDAARSEADARASAIDDALKAKGLGLYAFQRLGVAWLAGRDTALLSDDMGCGKTVQALAAVPEGAPILVICPAVAKGVWLREAARWRPDIRTVALAGRGSFRWPAAGELVAVNPDILDEAPGKAPPGCVLIIDEAHNLKNHKAKRTKAARACSAAARAAGGKVWLLTATPLLNRPTELWGVLEAADLGREAFGGWKGFVDAFQGYAGEWGGYEWGGPRSDVPARLARVMLRRRKVDVLPDLPPKRSREVPVDLDKATLRACDAALTELRKRGIDLDDPKAELPSGGLAFETLSRVRAILATAKIPAMLALVEEHEEAEEPLVVMSAHRAPIDLLGDRPGWATITGDTPPEVRTAIEAQFQAGALKGVACTIKAGGIAITLTRASNVLFVDRDWTPALNSQAEDRVYRIGQDRAVLITILVGSHAIDERITELLGEKTVLVHRSVDRAATTGAPSAPARVEVQPSFLPPKVGPFAVPGAIATAPENPEPLRLEVTSANPPPIAAQGILREENGRLVAHVTMPYDGSKTTISIGRPEDVTTVGTAPTEPPPSGTHPVIVPGENAPREPENDVERWAGHGLVCIAGMDPDFAQERNGEGFSKVDGAFGHSLAERFESTGKFTTRQWSAAVALATKYRRQIGDPPKRGER